LSAAAEKQAPSRRKKPEKFMLRVIRGGFEPADPFVARRLRERSYKLGDFVAATLAKPRNPRFNNLAHRLGELIAENIDDFAGMNAHQVLKRIQIEADIACDLVPMWLPFIGKQRVRVDYRLPQSLSFESMEEGEFRAVVRLMSDYVASTYWHGLTPEQIESMAELMPESA
jgi:hypothetical protein